MNKGAVASPKLCLVVTELLTALLWVHLTLARPASSAR
ncbi:hypothetical protein ACP70R_024699 [Stipagrostis hirtigluma subsp. patula]